MKYLIYRESYSINNERPINPKEHYLNIEYHSTDKIKTVNSENEVREIIYKEIKELKERYNYEKTEDSIYDNFKGDRTKIYPREYWLLKKNTHKNYGTKCDTLMKFSIQHITDEEYEKEERHRMMMCFFAPRFD